MARVRIKTCLRRHGKLTGKTERPELQKIPESHALRGDEGMKGLIDKGIKGLRDEGIKGFRD